MQQNADVADLILTPPGPLADERARRREHRGWSFYDWAASAFSTTVVTVFLGPYLTAVAQSAEEAGERITILGLVPVTAESYYPYMVTLSVVLQVLLVPLVGAIADIVRSRKVIMAIFVYIGALATMCLYFVQGSNYQLGGILFVLANVAFGAAIVVYNSYLPEIAGPSERDSLSARAWALGYVGGGLLLVLNLALYLGHESIGIAEDFAVRISLLSAGAWWALFALIPLSRIRTRQREDRVTTRIVSSGFKQLTHTLSDLRNYPQALLFLVAFFFFNDGIQTVIALSATFASQELGLGTTIIIAAVLIVQVVGIIGALTMARLAKTYGAKKVVLGSLVLWSVVLVFAFLMPAGSGTLFLVLGAFIGFVLGGSQALSRSLFAQLVPRDRQAEYFSLYEVSNGASSILGPLLFAVTLQFLGSYRIAIIALVIFFIIGGVLLARVNVQQGIADISEADVSRE